MTDRTRVVVVDDQRIVREGLVLILDLLPGIEVVGTAGDGEQALSVVAAQRPDVVLMDLRMPRMDGAQATAQIRARHPGTEVVVLTTYVDDSSVLAALRAGARGYLTKDARPAEIAAAITAVRNGQSQLDPGVQRRLVDTVAAGTPAPPDGLTAREVEVLVLIAQGRSNAEIAARLVISAATVKTHINNLFGKAGLHDRAQAVSYAFSRGLCAPPAETSRSGLTADRTTDGGRALPEG